MSVLRLRRMSDVDAAAATMRAGTVVLNESLEFAIHDGSTEGGQALGSGAVARGAILLSATRPTDDPLVGSGKSAICIVTSGGAAGEVWAWNGTSWDQII